MANKKSNPYDNILENLNVDGDTYKFYDVLKIKDKRYGEYTNQLDPLFF